MIRALSIACVVIWSASAAVAVAGEIPIAQFVYEDGVGLPVTPLVFESQPVGLCTPSPAVTAPPALIWVSGKRMSASFARVTYPIGVPEPGLALLTALGAAILGAAAWRRQRAASP